MSKWKYTEPTPKRAAMKAVEAAIAKLSRLNRQYTEVTGIIGKPETEQRFTFEVLIGGGNKFQPLIANLGGLFNWEINANNIAQVAEAFTAAYEESKDLVAIKDKRITQEAADKQAAERIAQDIERDQKTNDASARACANEAIMKQITPANAAAVILAELNEDQCDIQTDYFSHKTTRTVLIGFRTGKKEDFRQLRAAAGRFEETKHLGTGCDRFHVKIVFANAIVDIQGNQYHEGFPSHWHKEEERVFYTRAEADAYVLAHSALESMGFGELTATFRFQINQYSVEHRENYSMGSGNYLKDGHTDSSGWRVYSRALPLDRTLLGDPNLQICCEALAVPTPEPVSEGYSATSHWNGDVKVSRNIEKDGIEIRFKVKPSADVLSRLKGMGYRWSPYSSCWYCKHSPQRLADALRFVQSLTGTATQVTGNDEVAIG
jgi:hypothetical protein